ncbi:hypothetical protein CFOL_v3_30393 [Cephalotus follicularis]|uniref:Uncharacterized protein n=1 Tax=Cephalotus follicularis TaxID=3775 RepID=A0A1Q3D390_CEPFO|nr:hypothetical protein CFOL_v3_30393 [Cephalotus follicularis]
MVVCYRTCAVQHLLLLFPWNRAEINPNNQSLGGIIQAGVSEVVYFVEKRSNNSDIAYIASHKLLSMAVLQCLTYTEPLVAYLQSGKHKNYCELLYFLPMHVHAHTCYIRAVGRTLASIMSSKKLTITISKI